MAKFRNNQFYAKTKKLAIELQAFKGGLDRIFKVKRGRHKGEYFVGTELEWFSYSE